MNALVVAAFALVAVASSLAVGFIFGVAYKAKIPQPLWLAIQLREWSAGGFGRPYFTHLQAIDLAKFFIDSLAKAQVKK